MSHLFLSYRSTESAFAHHLAAQLRTAGVAIWVDRLRGIQGGDDWIMALEQAINGSRGLVAVLSPAYVTSAYCRRELHRADALQRPIYPVLLADVPPTDWPLELQKTQFIDFRNWQNADAFARAFTELLHALGQHPEPMPLDPLRASKIKRLQARLALTLEKLNAADTQLTTTLNAADKPALEQQLSHLEQEAERLQAELNQLTRSTH